MAMGSCDAQWALVITLVMAMGSCDARVMTRAHWASQEPIAWDLVMVLVMMPSQEPIGHDNRALVMAMGSCDASALVMPNGLL